MTTNALTTLTDARIAALTEIADPLERAKVAGTLERQAAAQAAAYATERATAIKEACEAPGATQAGVAAALGISRGAIGKVLARLEARA